MNIIIDILHYNISFEMLIVLDCIVNENTAIYVQTNIITQITYSLHLL